MNLPHLNPNTSLKPQWITLENGEKILAIIVPQNLIEKEEGIALENLPKSFHSSSFLNLEFQRVFLILSSCLDFLPHDFKLKTYCRYYHHERELADLELMDLSLTHPSEEEIPKSVFDQTHEWLSDCLQLQKHATLIDMLFNEHALIQDEHHIGIHTRDSFIRALEKLYNQYYPGQPHQTWATWQAIREKTKLQNHLSSSSSKPIHRL